MSGVALLLDENLSEAILGRLARTFPGSVHVRPELGTGVSDLDVWNFARERGLVLVTRDEDFERLSALRGAPPKVVWLSLHNAGNAEVLAVLEGAGESIARFVADDAAALLVLGQ